VSEHRQNNRKAVGLLVKLAHKGIDEFVEKYATNLSDGGMFIRSRDPKPLGTLLNFKIEIANGVRVLQGRGVVKWVRGANDPAGPSGMGIQFEELDDSSRTLIDVMLGKDLVPSPAPAIELELEVDDEAAAASPPHAIDFDLDALISQSSAISAARTETATTKSSELDFDFDSLIGELPPPPSLDDFFGAPIPVPVAPEPVVTPPPVAKAPIPPVAVAAPQKAPPPAAPAEAEPPELEIDIDFDTTEAPKPPQFSSSSIQQAETVFLKQDGPIDPTGIVIGIDLGTTNSACAVLTKGRPVIMSSKDGYNTIPSVVALSRMGKLQVGHRAKQQMVLNPGQSIFGAKRLVGREYDSATVQNVRERFHYEIVRGHGGKAAVKLGEHVLALEEVQGLVLKECKEMAEQFLGQKVSRAVVTCPAYYSEPQREAVRKAGHLAGLKIERVLNEPTAAALAFGLNKELSKKILVYDLGGGTFDATLMRIDKNVFEVLATGGDVFLGGVDFDNQIVDLLLEKYAVQHGRPFAGDPVALSRVSEVAERAKIALSEQTIFEVHLPMLEMDAATATPRDMRCSITRAEYETKCADLIDRTFQAVQDVLLDAKMKASEVDDIILVGGMSRMPMVREKLKALFKKPPHASVNADEAVALGAALYSGTVDKVSSLVLIDVVPMTIGIGKPGGGFHRLIERNSPLPVTKSFGVSTQEDNQTALEVMLFQGEDSQVAANEFLGALRIDGLPKAPKGAIQVAVTLKLDAECVLSVEAREFRSRQLVKATLGTRYTSEDVARRLGISDAKMASSNEKRAEELQKRAGGFWSKLKKVFSRK
jgi:molecular chaperone DnaK